MLVSWNVLCIVAIFFPISNFEHCFLGFFVFLSTEAALSFNILFYISLLLVTFLF